MKKVIKDLLRDFFTSTTLHGLSNMMTTGTPPLRRLLWLVAIICVNAGFALVMVLYIISYLKYEYIISTKSVQRESQRFPAITACNLNFFSNRKINEELLFADAYLTTQFTELTLSEALANFTAEERETEFQKNYYRFMMNTTYTADEFFVSCRLGLRRPGESCTPYVTQLVADGGVCYTFHSKEFIRANGALRSTHDGIADSLVITFNIHTDDYWYSLLNAKGMLIDVHSPDDQAYIDKSTLMLSPGTSTLMALQAVSINEDKHDY